MTTTTIESVMTLESLNASLEIVSITNDIKFSPFTGRLGKGFKTIGITKGFCFQIEGHGYLSMNGDVPYTLLRKKYLQQIIDAGGFCGLNNGTDGEIPMTFVQEWDGVEA